MRHVVLFTCMLVLTGCIFQGDKLPFETVARGESTYQGESPLLFVATSYEDTRSFSLYTGHVEALSRIDYSQYVVACAFLGVKPEGYDIEVKELIRKEGAIILLTVFKEPAAASGEREVSPFHIITIRRSDIYLTGEVSFLLEDTRGLLHAKVVVEIT